MKRTWFQAQINQDIAISTLIEHESILAKREDRIAFLQKEGIHKHISQSYQEHSHTSYERHKQSHNLISSISW
jgi:ABC-type uncharacterized transport system substrate-binding protein